MSGPARPTVLVRCDASRAIGMGHLRRCLVLAGAWAAAGGRAIFALHNPTEGAVRRLVCAGHQVVPLAALDSSAELIALAHQHDAAWIVIDHYSLGEPFLSRLQNARLPTLAIDDLCAHPFPVDVLLNQNLDSEALDYVTPARTVRLFGPTYALVGESYRTARAQATGQRKDGVLISFGGSDPFDRTSFTLAALNRIERRLHVIVAIGSEYLGAVSRLAQASPHHVVVHHDLPDLATAMGEAVLMIGAGGSTVWEACCMGLPMVLAPFAENQRPIARSLVRHGAAVDASDLDEGALAALVDRVLGSALQTIAARASALVDGAGAARVLEVIR